MSFVNPLAFVGQSDTPARVPTLSSLAAANVARQLHTDYDEALMARYEQLNQTGHGGIDSSFQLARAKHIAEEAAKFEQNQRNDRYTRWYEDVMFTPAEHTGKRNADGLTSEMRTKKDLMEPFLRDRYFNKLSRRARNNSPSVWNPLGETLTPEERRARMPYRPPEAFYDFFATYAGVERRPWVSQTDAAHSVADRFGIPLQSAKTVVTSAWTKFQMG